MRAVALVLLVACADRQAPSPPPSPSPSPSPPPSASPSPSPSTASAPTAPSTARDAGPSDPCDALVQAARERGPVGLEKSNGTKLDPLCEWKIDDAKASAEGTGPGIRSTWGRVDPTTFAKMFRASEKTVRACAKDSAEAKPVLRVRVWFDANGRAIDALTDYRVTLPDAVRACVVDAMKKLALTKPETASSAVYAFDTSSR